MNRLVRPFVTSVALAVCAAGSEAQTRPSALPIFVDYFAPPKQIDQFVKAVDAVVIVRVDSAQFKSLTDSSGGYSSDVTAYEMRVLDSLKSHFMLPAVGGTLTLIRLGGQHTEDGRIVRSAVVGFEDFQTNGEYLLFLTWNEKLDRYDIAYGPDGSYQLTSATTRPLGRSALAQSQLGKDRNAFVKEIRSALAK